MEHLWRSTVGRKFVMALTGALLFLFLVGHLAGNLQVFGSPDLINAYAHFLKSKPGLIWGARIGLLAVVGLHIASAVSLARQNRAARPVPYAGARQPYGASAASRLMLVSGLVVLAFVIYHLLQFTALVPAVNGGVDFRRMETSLPNGVRTHDVYAMMIRGFQIWWVSLFYLLAQALLFMHLSHGLASLFQSLGLRSSAWWPRVVLAARVASVALFLGYASIPVAVLAGLGGSYVEKARATALTASVGEEVVR
ncbi:MAG: succinate dehydrogenase cytochrome b subunit [Verrucomicrobia bacterium]|nr:succinate dehydrogenase cytochrome b subunit [Verrucomicrobiota bacterium]